MTHFLVDWRDGMVRVIFEQMTNHALRAVLIGFWLSLDDDDRADHIRELMHYESEDGKPPPTSVHIAQAIREARKEPDQ